MKNTVNNPITLAHIKVGESCKVSGFKELPRNKKRHLLDMGITKGTVIKMEKRAPFRDPVSVLIRGYSLCLRKSDMENILVEVI